MTARPSKCNGYLETTINPGICTCATQQDDQYSVKTDSDQYKLLSKTINNLPIKILTFSNTLDPHSWYFPTKFQKKDKR